MVNVTKENFIELSNDLLDRLPTASFVALDEEMTGIQCVEHQSTRYNKDDTPSQRYAKRLKAVAERYHIIQIGIALFHVDESKGGDGFQVRKYNFYIFPAANAVQDVSLNPSAVAFLHQQSMDFQMWTKRGIPYATGKQASSMIADYHEKQKQENEKQKRKAKAPNPSNHRVHLSRTMDIEFHARAMASLREWLDSAQQQRPQPQPHQADEPLAPSEGTSFLLPSCNAFLRRALYESIQLEYPTLVLERGPNNQIRVWRMNAQERQFRRDRLAREAWEGLVRDEVGFWRVWHALVRANQGYQVSSTGSVMFRRSAPPTDASSEALGDDDNSEEIQLERPIPIVVHNGLMDVLFLMSHMHSRGLPHDWPSAKALVHSYLPNIYDTKVLSTECIAAATRPANTVLGALYAQLRPGSGGGNAIIPSPIPLQVVPYIPPNGGNIGDEMADSANGQIHEAAHDAFMTGAVFVELVVRILREWASRTIESEGGASNLGNHITLEKGLNFNFPLLTMPVSETDEDDVGANIDVHDFQRQVLGRNKLYLMMTIYTIDLQDPVRDPLNKGFDATTTFRVVGSDPAVSTRDIVQCITSQPGENQVHFEIVWVNDRCFMVATQNATPVQARTVRLALQNRYPNALVKSLDEHLREEEQREVVVRSSSWTDRVWGWLGWRRSHSLMEGSESGDEGRNKRRRTS